MGEDCAAASRQKALEAAAPRAAESKALRDKAMVIPRRLQRRRAKLW
jgi:hypothetical protein